LVTGKAPRKVLLQPDGGQAIAVPSALLALHSQLFDELFESLLEGEGTPEVSHAMCCVALFPSTWLLTTHIHVFEG
jgi:hypothetical protein